MSYIPPGLSPIVPQLVIAGAHKAHEFYRAAFGAEVLHSMAGPKGSVMHSSVRIGDAIFRIGLTEFAKPTTSNTYIYVEDVDAVFERAVKAARRCSSRCQLFWAIAGAWSPTRSGTSGNSVAISKMSHPRRWRAAAALHSSSKPKIGRQTMAMIDWRVCVVRVRVEGRGKGARFFGELFSWRTQACRSPAAAATR
jgi:uncharacterized glyoxalase superfamily protein PhnB